MWFFDRCKYRVFIRHHNSNLLFASEKLDININNARVQFSIEIYYCARNSQSIDSISLNLRDFNLFNNNTIIQVCALTTYEYLHREIKRETLVLHSRETRWDEIWNEIWVFRLISRFCESKRDFCELFSFYR